MDNNAAKKGMNLMTAGFAGVVIGAGIGAAVMRVFSDKKTRERVLNSLSGAKERILSYSHRISMGKAKRGRKPSKD